MLFLHCFSAPLAHFELPLVEQTADALVDVLLAPTCDQRSERFVAALQESPPLVIWMLDRCRLKGIALEVPTLVGMVDHLGDDFPQALIDSLARRAPDAVHSTADDRSVMVTAADAADAIAGALEVSRRAVSYLDREARRLSQAIAIGATSATPNDHQSQEIEVARCLGLLCTMDTFGQAGDSANRWLSREKTIAVQSLIAKLEPFLGPQKRSAISTAAEAVYHALADWNMQRDDEAALDETRAALQREWVTVGSACDRIRQLAESLCRLDRLERDFSAALEEAKLQAMYKLAAGAGHEINNPLGSIAGRAQLLLRDESDPERRRTLAKINSQAFRAHEMIADMMLFARPPLPQLDQITPAALIQSLLDEMQEMTQQQDAEMISHVTTEIATLRVDPAQLRVALRAMCTNSLEATGLGGRVEIFVSDGPRDATGLRLNHDSLHSTPVRTVQITVRDNGPGFSEEERQHLFDPFYSGREAGRGLGFGLSKCWRIVRNHGGSIDVRSDPGRGATFEITLPVA